MFEWITDIFPIIAAVLTASYLYVIQTTGSSPEKFNITKWFSTVIIGGGIALIFSFTGSPISSETIGIQLITYSGLIIIIEKGVKYVFRTAVTIDISSLEEFLPKTQTVPAAAAAQAAVPVSVPVSDQNSGISPVVVTVKPNNSPVLTPEESSGGFSLGLKFVPALIQGVSPLPVVVHAVADPASGEHEVVTGIIDWQDGTPAQSFIFDHGVAKLTHTYEYVQAETIRNQEISDVYAREFYPHLTVKSRDGLIKSINNAEGRSLIITVKDAEAVRLGKVTNFPAPV